jgi:hypothetical protein
MIKGETEGFIKVRVKATGLITEVSPTFDRDGNFLGFRDVDEIQGTHIIWPNDVIEPIEPDWEAARIRFAETALREIIRYDQGANTYESTADMAAEYANALVGKLKEQFKKGYENK